MMQRSVLLSGGPEELSLFRDALLIEPDDFQIVDERTLSYDFLQAQRNGAFISEVNGEFSYAADIFLFGRSENWVSHCLQDLSKQGITLAIPDEMSPSPFHHIIYQDAKTLLADVFEDEETGDLTVQNLSIYD